MSATFTTLESDLQVLSETHCPVHETIYFCKNKNPNNETPETVYKYHYCAHFDKWFRVQCCCCDYKGPSQDLVLHPILTKQPTGENSRNHIFIQPMYSVYCPEQKRMVVFEKIIRRNLSEVFKGYIFDPATLKFKPSTCKCQVCEDSKTLHALSNLEHGAQGATSQRQYHNWDGKPLICLSMTWFNEHHSVMDVFCDRTGAIGKYTWIEDGYFECNVTLDVRVTPIDYTEKDTLWDSQLRILYTEYCPHLQKTMFYAFHGEECDNRVKKFIFNKLYKQFEKVKCACEFEQEKLQMVCSTLNYGSVEVKIQNNRTVEKRISMGKNKFVLETGPIRISDKIGVNEHQIRRIKQEKAFQHPNCHPQLIVTSWGFEGYVIGKYTPKKDFAEDQIVNDSLVAVVSAEGEILPFVEIEEDDGTIEYELVVELLGDKQNEECEEEDDDKTIVASDESWDDLSDDISELEDDLDTTFKG